MRLYSSKRQRGIVIVLVTILLPVLLFIMGLALDFGYVYVSKTRLQNAVDAAALSAAITLARNTGNQAAATAAGNATFNTFINSPGNTELAQAAGLAVTLSFQYGNTLNPFGYDGSGNPAVFVQVTSNNVLQVTPMLLSMLPPFSTNTVPIPAVATAGPVGQNCSLVPFVLCADMTHSSDTNCYSGNCYGYATSSSGITHSYPLSYPPTTSSVSGFFDLLALDASQSGDISNTLPATTNTCLQNGSLNVEQPSWSLPLVMNGFDTRFTADTDTASTTYTQYKTGGTGNGSRIMAVPVANCIAGASNITQISKPFGVSCVFLDTNPKISGQFNVEVTGDLCQQNGVWDPTNPVLNGPYKIVLFKTSSRGDS